MHPFIKKAPALPRLLGKAGYRQPPDRQVLGRPLRQRRLHQRHDDQGPPRRRRASSSAARRCSRSTTSSTSASDKPFFVWYAPMMPHEPHNPPERLLKKYGARAGRERLAKYLRDERVVRRDGRRAARLPRPRRNWPTTRWSSSCVDNGWIQETGEKRTTRGWFAPSSKMSPYDGGLRTPVAAPLAGPRRSRDATTTSSRPSTSRRRSWRPAASRCRRRWPGVSLLDVAAGKGRCRARRSSARSSSTPPSTSTKPAVNLTHRWVREGDWKLIVPVKGTPGAVRREADPHEKADQASAKPERVRELTTLLDAWWKGR